MIERKSPGSQSPTHGTTFPSSVDLFSAIDRKCTLTSCVSSHGRIRRADLACFNTPRVVSKELFRTVYGDTQIVPTVTRPKVDDDRLACAFEHDSGHRRISVGIVLYDN